VTRPGHWLWSHDIKPDQIASLGPPGWSLVSLSSYGDLDRRRFAAVLHEGPGAGRIPVLDLEPSAIETRLRHARVSPVAVTAGPGLRPHLSVLVEGGPDAGTRVAAGLSEAELRALLGRPGGPGGIADITTYTVRGARQYAVVLDPRAAPSLLFTGVTAGQLRRELRRSGATVTRLRAYAEGGRPLLAAVAERSARGFSAWYDGLDADGVAQKLDRHRAYPVDLGATRDDRGVRYTVVMRR
jgi:hypothetical protein